jgi:hypothetical protein
MEFKKIQGQQTSYFINGKTTTEEQFCFLEALQKQKGKTYNSSLTKKKGENFIHTFSYN